MTILDGSLPKRSVMERIIDPVLKLERLLAYAGSVCAICVLATPAVLFLDFRYFTTTEGPWWLNVIDYCWALGFLFSAAVLVLLLLAKSIDSRSD
jgi:hypothetical protein